jgi:RNA polymerase sigma-70 factor (ECF subfamily)
MRKSEVQPPHIVVVAEPSDEMLVERIAAGDKPAMRELFTRHQVRVYRFVIPIVKDRCQAEDVVNAVFLDVWRQAGRFAARSTVSTWILAIARHKAISAIRRRADTMIDYEAAEYVADPADDPEVVLHKKVAGALLRRCLEALSADHRTIIDLVYYHNKSVSEVAEIVGIPANTVKTRMFYARRRLAALLAAIGVDRVAA